MKFKCILCNYSTKRKYDFKRHLKSKKHLNKNNKFICECGKEYKYNTGLSKHRKKCVLKNKLEEMKNEIISLKDKNRIMENNTYKILEVIKQSSENNNDLIHQVKKLKEKNDTSVIQNQNIQNIQNQNIQNNMQNISINVFLNKHCKNAMNLTDFVEKLQVTFEDLLYTGETNYVERNFKRILIKI